MSHVSDVKTVGRLIVSESAATLVAVFLFGIAINLLALTAPIYMLQVYDRVLASSSVETLVYISLMAAVALLAFAMLEGVRARLLGRIGARFHDRMMTLLFRRTIFMAALAVAPGRPPYDRDVDQVRAFVGGPPVTAFLDFPWIFVFLGFLYVLHPLFLYTTLIAALILVILALLTEVVTRGRVRKAASAAHIADLLLGSARRNAQVVEGMGMRLALERRWRAAQDEALTSHITAQDRESHVGGVSKFIRLATQSAMLGLGAWLVIRAQATPGVMIAASIVAARALAPIDIAIGSWKTFVGAREATKRLNAFLATSGERPESMELSAPRGLVELEAATLHLPQNPDPVLGGITLTVEPGQALAIMGPSAAGKSSLLRMIAGIWMPTHGAVRLDGALTFTWPREQLGRSIGILPQEVALFSGTVAENIARMQEPDPQAVIAAAKMARAHEIILRLPKGYETPVGDHGINLSGGYQQRIGLARALYGNPVLVLLDEPNSHLDQKGEEALESCINELVAAQRTVIIVAHRPSVLKAATHVAILEDGVLKDFGMRNDVLQRIQTAELAALKTKKEFEQHNVSSEISGFTPKTVRHPQYKLRPVVVGKPGHNIDPQ